MMGIHSLEFGLRQIRIWFLVFSLCWSRVEKKMSRNRRNGEKEYQTATRMIADLNGKQ